MIKGQRVTIQIYDGATHKFIDSTLVARRGLPTQEFEGFSVEVDNGRTMPCVRKASGLTVTLGKYNIMDDFYILDLADIKVVLGVQWLNTLDTISQNYKTIELAFNTPDGRRAVLRGMANKFKDEIEKAISHPTHL